MKKLFRSPLLTEIRQLVEILHLFRLPVVTERSVQSSLALVKVIGAQCLSGDRIVRILSIGQTF